MPCNPAVAFVDESAIWKPLEPDDETPLIATADEEIRPQIVQIFALVGEAMAGATHALLSGDRELAKNVVEKDRPSTRW